MVYDIAFKYHDETVLSDVLREVKGSLSQSEYVDVLKWGFEKIGVGYFSYVHLECCPAEADGAVILGNYPSKWVFDYERRSLYKTDPVIYKASESMKPFFWDEIGSLKNTEIFEKSSIHGIEKGFSIPIHGPRSSFSSMHFATENEDEEFDGLILRNYSSILAISFVAHHYFPSVVRSEDLMKKSSVVLSERERECLHWMALGKTYSEIAMILDISERTVKFHAKSIISKLDSVNIKQAISKAIRKGWL